MKTYIKDFFLSYLPKKVIVVDRVNFILERARNKEVLHLGCADAGLINHKIINDQLLHLQLCKVAKKVVGVDVNEQALATLRKIGVNNLYLMDFTQANIPIIGKFELIVAGEIIEHLDDFRNFFLNLQKFSNNDTEIIITTPNAFSFWNFFNIVRKREIVHPDHTCYFSYVVLSNLTKKYGFQIKELYVYCIKSVHNLKQAILQKLVDFLIFINPYFADGLILVLKKK